ncbi:hypothetical protein DM02DRAFT_629775 [Periconia macrospinosa]|uniref:Uncharacterized protein n=1 Tax=Periconia macrospinosa TaxID=97972 RepID=A0A2V1DN17_9PLEO|nr:hypothetical protein DM02DRAFT_629775 [Periconia macrospinosa]
MYTLLAREFTPQFLVPFTNYRDACLLKPRFPSQDDHPQHSTPRLVDLLPAIRREVEGRAAKLRPLDSAADESTHTVRLFSSWIRRLVREEGGWYYARWEEGSAGLDGIDMEGIVCAELGVLFEYLKARYRSYGRRKNVSNKEGGREGEEEEEDEEEATVGLIEDLSPSAIRRAILSAARSWRGEESEDDEEDKIAKRKEEAEDDSSDDFEPNSSDSESEEEYNCDIDKEGESPPSRLIRLKDRRLKALDRQLEEMREELGKPMRNYALSKVDVKHYDELFERYHSTWKQRTQVAAVPLETVYVRERGVPAPPPPQVCHERQQGNGISDAEFNRDVFMDRPEGIPYPYKNDQQMFLNDPNTKKQVEKYGEPYLYMPCRRPPYHFYTPTVSGLKAHDPHDPLLPPKGVYKPEVPMFTVTNGKHSVPFGPYRPNVPAPQVPNANNLAASLQEHIDFLADIPATNPANANDPMPPPQGFTNPNVPINPLLAGQNYYADNAPIIPAYHPNRINSWSNAPRAPHQNTPTPLPAQNPNPNFATPTSDPEFGAPWSLYPPAPPPPPSRPPPPAAASTKPTLPPPPPKPSSPLPLIDSQLQYQELVSRASFENRPQRHFRPVQPSLPPPTKPLRDVLRGATLKAAPRVLYSLSSGSEEDASSCSVEEGRASPTPELGKHVFPSPDPHENVFLPPVSEKKAFSSPAPHKNELVEQKGISGKKRPYPFDNNDDHDHDKEGGEGEGDSTSPSPYPQSHAVDRVRAKIPGWEVDGERCGEGWVVVCWK